MKIWESDVTTSSGKKNDYFLLNEIDYFKFVLIRQKSDQLILDGSSMMLYIISPVFTSLDLVEFR